jgi:Ca2+-binding EF-hand superfamily protein
MITNGEDYDLPPEGTRVRLVGLKNPSLNGKVGTISNYARDGERVMISLDDGPGIVKVKPKQIEELFEDDYYSDNSGRGGGDYAAGGGRGGGRRGGRGGGGRHHHGMRRHHRMNGSGRGMARRNLNEGNRSMSNRSMHRMDSSKNLSAHSRNSNQDEEMMDILRSADAMFDIADTSGDGLLTFEEFEFYMRKHTDHDIDEIIHCFDEIDVDGNGNITRDEVRTAFLKKKREVDGKSMGQSDMDMLKVSRDADKFFDQADVDKDGTLTKREFMVYLKRKTDHSEKAIADLFLMMDVDRDGFITKEEVRKVYMQERQQHLEKGNSGGETLALLLGLEDEDMEKLEEDVYNMFFLAEIGSQAFWFSLFVWMLKLGLIYMIAYDLYTTYEFPPSDNPSVVRLTQLMLLPVNIAIQEELVVTFFIYANLRWDETILEVSPHATSSKYHAANMMRCIDGLSFLFINTTLLLQATGILGMFLNFAALGFLQTIDNVALRLARDGYLSDKLEDVAESVDVMKLPRNNNECLQVMDSVFLCLTYLILLIAWALVAFVFTQ